jgi:3-methylcrotonyl-CoA carboxylase alpha subunit
MVSGSSAKPASVLVVHHRGGETTMSIDGAVTVASPHSVAAILVDGGIAVMDQGETFTLRLRDPFEHAELDADVTDRVTAPMPGKIVRVSAEGGAAVKRGQPLVVLEAMKMEHTLTAPMDAQVESVDVAVGDQVREGTVVIRFSQPKTDRP